MFYEDNLVLVTGGAGFVGGHFVEDLLKRGARVRVPIHNRPLRVRHERIETINADLCNQDDCARACRGVDYVIHAAGAVSAAGVTVAGPMAAITTNLVLTARMLQAAWEEGVARFLLFSSSTGYPDANHPVKEEEFWSAPPHPSYFGYGWMRRYLEKIGEFTHERSSTKVAIVRPTATYGRYDDFNPTTSHVIPALIRRAVARENPYIVWGGADVVRDFLHITDLVRGSLLLLEKRCNCEPINIGYGEGVTIGHIVDLVLRSADHAKVKPVFDDTKPTTIPFRMADTAKARELLGFAPAVSIADGIRDTVEWYRRKIDDTG